MTNRTKLASAVILPLLLATGCGGGSDQSPTGPNGTSAQSCLTYQTAISGAQYIGASTTAYDSLSYLYAPYNTATNQITGSLKIKSMAGSAIPTDWIVTQYNSEADFIAAGGMELGRARSMTQVDTVSDGIESSLIIYSYDAQNRLTTVLATNTSTSISRPVHLTFTTVNSAWDNLGRPTAGTSDGSANGVSMLHTVLSVAYDDAARTVTSTSTSSAATDVTTASYDSNGFLTSQVDVQTYPGSSLTGTTRSLFTTTATSKICR